MAQNSKFDKIQTLSINKYFYQERKHVNKIRNLIASKQFISQKFDGKLITQRRNRAFHNLRCKNHKSKNYQKIK